MQYVAADAVIGLYAAHGQGLDVSIVAMLMSPTGYCMGVSNENVDLQTAAGDVLARLVSDGTINVMSASGSAPPWPWAISPSSAI